MTERISLLKRLSLLFSTVGVVNLLIGLVAYLSGASSVVLHVMLAVGGSFVVTGISLVIGAACEVKKG